MITCPSCLTAWVVWAKTLSPSLFFLASSGLSSAASNVVPLEMLAEFCPACAVADVEAEAFAEASVPEPFFSAAQAARGVASTLARTHSTLVKLQPIIPTRFVSFATASLFERQSDMVSQHSIFSVLPQTTTFESQSRFRRLNPVFANG